MLCVVCNRSPGEVVWHENGYLGRKCLCGTVCTSPEPPETIDPTFDGHPDAFYASYAAFKAKWVERLRPNGRLLEIGCGEGHFLAAAKRLGLSVAGVEPEPGRASRVARRLDVEVRPSLLEDIDWPNANFDIVYHCDLLSHFSDPIAALQQMGRLINRHGILAFEVGLLGGIHPFWYRWIKSLGYPEHRWFFSERALPMLLKRANLRIERVRRFGLAPEVAFHRLPSLVPAFLRKAAVKTHAHAKLDRIRPGLNDPLEQLAQFCRYRVGAFVPGVGPQTLFVAARPER